jgi:trk system potassium uptake protein TrkA
LLAQELDTLGHSVAVVDQHASAFRRLGSEFGGSMVTGMGFDRETLESAGIQRAHGFAAVSSGDNTNIIAARVARETYGVERVVARIYDLKRAEIYERLGIPTVATVSWTATQMMQRLLPHGSLVDYRDPSGTMTLADIAVDGRWFGRPLADLEDVSGARIAFLTRYGTAFLPTSDTVLQEGDLVHALFPTDQRDRVERAMGSQPLGTP